METRIDEYYGVEVREDGQISYQGRVLKQGLRNNKLHAYHYIAGGKQAMQIPVDRAVARNFTDIVGIIEHIDGDVMNCHKDNLKRKHKGKGGATFVRIPKDLIEYQGELIHCLYQRIKELEKENALYKGKIELIS